MMALGLFVGLLGSANAQTYPTRTVHIILGQPAGAALDVTMRLIGTRLSTVLGQPVVIENRVGANATIATNLVVRAAPDGYTFWYGTPAGSHPMFNVTNGSVFGKDLMPVSNVATVPFVFYVAGRLPVRTFDEFIAYAKSQPAGKLNFALIVSQHELLMSLLKARTGVTYTPVPYRQGGAPAIASALLKGEVDFAFAGLAGFAGHLPTGAIRALMTTAGKRVSALPDMPTSTELGIKNFEAVSNTGLAAPIGTPPAIIQRISTEVARIVRDPEIASRIRSFGNEPVGSTPEEQLRAFEAEMSIWTEAARISNFKI